MTKVGEEYDYGGRRATRRYEDVFKEMEHQRALDEAVKRGQERAQQSDDYMNQRFKPGWNKEPDANKPAAQDAAAPAVGEKVGQDKSIEDERAGRLQQSQAAAKSGAVAPSAAAKAAGPGGAGTTGKAREWIDKKRGAGPGGGKGVAVGGAIEGFQKGGVTGAAGGAASGYLLYAALGGLLTLAGSVPSLIYLNFHYLMSKMDSKYFSAFSLWQKVVLAVADFLAVIILVIVIGIIIIPFAICNKGGVTGAAIRTGSTVGSWIGILPVNVCKVFSFSTFGGGQSGGGGATGAWGTCEPGELPQIAAQNRVPYPTKNAPELDNLIACVNEATGYSGIVYTYDQNHPTCNYTRGLTRCDSSCSHAVYSCHYGGETGTEGSLGVDYPVTRALGQRIVDAAKRCGAKFPDNSSLSGARCETASGTRIDCSNVVATHVHITAAGCDRN